MPSKRKGDSQVRTRAESKRQRKQVHSQPAAPPMPAVNQDLPAGGNQPATINPQPPQPAMPVPIQPPQAAAILQQQLLVVGNTPQPALGLQPVVQPALGQQQVVSAPQPLPALPLPAYMQGELDPLPIATYKDYEIFISDVTKDKIWNGQYVELALLLKQNFASVQSVAGTLAVIDNQLSIKPATSKIKQPIKN